MDLLVKCDYHTAGCPWTGQLKNWQVRREGGRNNMIVLALSVHNTSLSPSPLFLPSFTVPFSFPLFLLPSFSTLTPSLPPSSLTEPHWCVCLPSSHMSQQGVWGSATIPPTGVTRTELLLQESVVWTLSHRDHHQPTEGEKIRVHIRFELGGWSNDWIDHWGG